MKLDIPTFDAHDAESLNLLHSEFEPGHKFLVSQVDGSGGVSHSPILLTALVREKLHDPSCRQIPKRLNTGYVMPFQLKEDGILQRTVHSNPVIFIPKSLQQRVIYIAHSTQIAGHPGEEKRFYYLRQHFYWPSMCFDTYSVAKNCPSCARESIKLRKYAPGLRLFPATDPLAYVRINILGPLLE